MRASTTRCPRPKVFSAKAGYSPMDVALIDYGAGNLHSAAKALERAAREGEVGARVRVTSAPAEVRRADAIVLPGVGAFGDCLQGLLRVEGLAGALEARVRGDGVPFLGICVGMQLMARRGLEHGVHAGLDWIGGEVDEIRPSDTRLKVPHMGWNEVCVRAAAHGVLRRLVGLEAPYAYFVHSFAFRPDTEETLLATTDYGGEIAAIIGKDNLIGTQFHPEKSQVFGLALLGAFLRWRP